MPRKPRKDKKLVPYRQREFDAYVLWCSLPAQIIGRPTEDLRKFGFKNEMLLELVSLTTQKEFAKRFKVGPDRLSAWNKKIEDEGLVDIQRRRWGKDLTANVDLAFYKKTLEEADAARVRLWYEIFCGKTTEGMPPAPVVQNIQINQKIIKLTEEYGEKLRQAYIDEIQSDQ